MNENVNYFFKKAYETPEGTFKEGSEFRFFRGMCYFNGGMVSKYYADMLVDILKNSKLKAEYIKEEPIIYNKV